MKRLLFLLFLTLAVSGYSQKYVSKQLSFTPDKKNPSVEQVFSQEHTIQIVNPYVLHVIDVQENDTVCLDLVRRMPDRPINDLTAIGYEIKFSDGRDGMVIFGMASGGWLDALLVSDYQWIMIFKIHYEGNLKI